MKDSKVRQKIVPQYEETLTKNKNYEETSIKNKNNKAETNSFQNPISFNKNKVEETIVPSRMKAISPNDRDRYRKLESLCKMCTVEELIIRQDGGQLSIFEMDPSTVLSKTMKSFPLAKPEWVIKKYRRSEAGQEDSHFFPLETLRKILDYILTSIVDVDNKKATDYVKNPGNERHTFWEIYDFVYDRFRAINKDLTLGSNRTHETTIKVGIYLYL